jgi:hypothetical protein
MLRDVMQWKYNALGAADYWVAATLKDSPHPHASMMLGFLNTNLELQETFLGLIIW